MVTIRRLGERRPEGDSGPQQAPGWSGFSHLRGMGGQEKYTRQEQVKVFLLYTALRIKVFHMEECFFYSLFQLRSIKCDMTLFKEKQERDPFTDLRRLLTQL